MIDPALIDKGFIGGCAALGALLGQLVQMWRLRKIVDGAVRKNVVPLRTDAAILRARIERIERHIGLPLDAPQDAK